MALVSRNETSNFLSPPSNHKKSTNMGKFPFVNPNPNFSINHQFSRKQLINGNGNNNGHNGEDLITVSDDASSFNQQFNQRKVPGSCSGSISLAHYVTYDVSRYSKSELRVLKSRLMSELEKVRNLSTRIESRGTKRSSPFQSKEISLSKRGRVGPPPPPQQPPSSYVASPHIMKMCGQVLTKVMKQKQGYVFNAPVDVVGMNLHDYHQIIKRPMDLGTIKKNLGMVGYYPTPEEFAADVRLTFNNALVYNPKGHEVHTLAERFRDKFEQSFLPVYQKFLVEKEQFLRAQHRTVESRHDSGGFAGDSSVIVVDEVQCSSWSKNPSPDPPPSQLPVIEIPLRKPDPRPEPRIEKPPPPPPLPLPPPPQPQPQPQPPKVLEPVREPVSVPEPEPVQTPVVAEVVSTQVQEVVSSVGPGRGSSGKLPKPKAKDPNKREMSMEEKHKLGAGLQSLPEEKMTQVINIIRRRNGHLTQEGDEIELDIEAVDKETLWELDRLVTNYKKMVSKMRRQALMVNNNVGHSDDQNQVDMSERMTETAKALKKSGGDVGDEDVDIGDEMPVQNFPPVEIDKDDDRNQGGGGCRGGDSSSSSSSGSSSSESSSSSDSDSGSSSGSDSDVDDAESRDNESKSIPH